MPIDKISMAQLRYEVCTTYISEFLLGPVTIPLKENSSGKVVPKERSLPHRSTLIITP